MSHFPHPHIAECHLPCKSDNPDLPRSKGGIAQTLDELPVDIQVNLAAACDNRDQVAPTGLYRRAGAAGHHAGSIEFIEIDFQVEVPTLVDNEVIQVGCRAIRAKNDAAGAPRDDRCLHFEGKVGKVRCQCETGVENSALRYVGVIAAPAKGTEAPISLSLFPVVALAIVAQRVVDDQSAAPRCIGIGFRCAGSFHLRGSAGEVTCIRGHERDGSALSSRPGGSGNIRAAEYEK